MREEHLPGDVSRRPEIWMTGLQRSVRHDPVLRHFDTRNLQRQVHSRGAAGSDENLSGDDALLPAVHGQRHPFVVPVSAGAGHLRPFIDSHTLRLQQAPEVHPNLRILRGITRVIRTVPSETVALDDGDLGTAPPRRVGSGNPGRAGADNDKVQTVQEAREACSFPLCFGSFAISFMCRSFSWSSGASNPQAGQVQTGLRISTIPTSSRFLRRAAYPRKNLL